MLKRSLIALVIISGPAAADESPSWYIPRTFMQERCWKTQTGPQEMVDRLRAQHGAGGNVFMQQRPGEDI